MPHGKALDVAMGKGRNAVFLSKARFDVYELEISEGKIAQACELASQAGVHINIKKADLETHQIKPDAYEVALCFNYLQHSLFPQLQGSALP